MSKQQTALSDAFSKAGYRAPSDRLLDAAMATWEAHPKGGDEAKDHLKRAVIGDAELLWEIFQIWYRPAAERILAEAARIRRERREKDSARLSPTRPSSDDTSLGAEMSADTKGKPPPTARGNVATQPLATYSRGAAPTAEQKEEARTFAARVISKLDTFRINGRPIGDCTPNEALAYRDARAKDNRFISMMVAGVPPNMRIKDCITPEEAEVFYRRAQEESTNE